LDKAFSALQLSGVVRPNYSEANARQHESNVQELLAAGIKVERAPDPDTATPEEIEAFLRRSQPPTSLANLQPREEAIDPFSMPLDEFNALNREPEKDPWA